jgi:hypothetical protein
MSVPAVVDVNRGWKEFLAPFAGHATTVTAYVGTDMDTLKATAPVPEKPLSTFYPWLVEHGYSVATTLKGVASEFRNASDSGSLAAVRHVAARPFMRWTLDAHDDYGAELARLAKHILRLPNLGGGDVGMTIAANLKLLGEQMVRDIRTTIIGMGIIDTQRMYRSIHVLRVGADNAATATATPAAEAVA